MAVAAPVLFTLRRISAIDCTCSDVKPLNAGDPVWSSTHSGAIKKTRAKVRRRTHCAGGKGKFPANEWCVDERSTLDFVTGSEARHDHARVAERRRVHPQRLKQFAHILSV